MGPGREFWETLNSVSPLSSIESASMLARVTTDRSPAVFQDILAHSDLSYTAAVSEAVASIRGYLKKQRSVWRECQWLFRVVNS